MATSKKVTKKVSKKKLSSKAQKAAEAKALLRGKKVKAKVRAIAQGQHGGRIVQPGEIFLFEGHLKEVDGEYYFPRWIEAPEGYMNLDDLESGDDGEDEDETELELGAVEEIEDEETSPKPDRATRASRPTVKAPQAAITPKERFEAQKKVEQKAANPGEDII